MSETISGLWTFNQGLELSPTTPPNYTTNARLWVDSQGTLWLTFGNVTKKVVLQ